MFPRFSDSPRLQSIAAWLRRVGPGTSLFLALVAAPAVFFGCFELTDGTRWGRSPSGQPREPAVVDRQVRVRLGGKTPRPAAELAVTSPFVVLDAVNGAMIAPQNEPLSPSSVRSAGAAGIQLGPRTFPSSDILIEPERDASIVLGGQTYRGRLRVRRTGTGLLFINQVDVESYLRGVLRGELPRQFHKQSFKALCVAARTYVLYQKQRLPADRLFDVGDDEGSQMYIGVRGEDPVADAAVDETTGEACVWSDGGADKLFCTYYSSACGGLSQPVANVKPGDPRVPPLAGNVACNDCYLAKFYRWDPVKLSKAEVTKRVVARFAKLKKLGVITDLRAKARTSDGRVIRIELIGTGDSDTLVGEDFRLSIGGRVLKSTNFKIETGRDSFTFKDGKGFGHGMGLCQYGMETKARRGMDYRKILSTYYPGSSIKKAY